MGSLTESSNENDLDQEIESSTFGACPTDRNVDLIVVERKRGALRFAAQEFKAATRRLEVRSEAWLNSQGEKRVASWWFETIRVSPENGIAAGDSVALAFYQGSTAEERLPSSADIVPFKSHNAKKKSRGPFPLSRSFQCEDEFLNWIDNQEKDFWQQTPFLVARLGRPSLIAPRSQFGLTSATLAFGLLRHPLNLDEVKVHLGSKKKVQKALSAIESAAKELIADATEHAQPILPMPHHLQSGVFNFLSKLTLAGPIDNHSHWYSRPISDFFCFLAEKYRDYLASMLTEDSYKTKSRPSATTTTNSPKPDDIREQVEIAKKSLADLEAMKMSIMRRAEDLRESIRVARNLLNQQNSPTDFD